MTKTITLSLEEQDVIAFALGVMLGHLGSTPQLLMIVNSIREKLADAHEEEPS